MRLWLAVCAVLLAAPAWGGTLNDVPSCYAAAHVTPADGRGYSRLFYVLIDQTVAWPRGIESEIMDDLNQNLVPGTKFVIADFSAFAQGRYLAVLHTGVIEAPLAARQVGDTPMVAAKLLAACEAGQLAYARRMADDATVAALEGSSGSLAHSDILGALTQVAPVLAAETAPDKALLLASDGLENSAAASFYRAGGMRDIDPQRELARAKAAGLVADFGGARVYVIGGALPPPGQAAYEGSKMLRDLAGFWAAWFRLCQARLVAFGAPELVVPVRF